MCKQFFGIIVPFLGAGAIGWSVVIIVPRSLFDLDQRVFINSGCGVDVGFLRNHIFGAAVAVLEAGVSKGSPTRWSDAE